jgi:hypothetical protein
MYNTPRLEMPPLYVERIAKLTGRSCPDQSKVRVRVLTDQQTQRFVAIKPAILYFPWR